MSENKILVVDDEKIILDLFEYALTNAGYIIQLAESAEEAIELLRHKTINVMFLDLNMPGMNGQDLCSEIRKDFPDAIIHAVSGYGSLFELADCREAGFDDYFAKPVKMSVLTKAAQEAFEKIDGQKDSICTEQLVLSQFQ